MTGIKGKNALKIVGVLTLIAGALPLLKPYVAQLAVVPTEGMAFSAVIAAIGLLGLYWGFSNSTTC